MTTADTISAVENLPTPYDTTPVIVARILSSLGMPLSVATDIEAVYFTPDQRIVMVINGETFREGEKEF